ncbi:MAG TPA: hypothetical protein VFA11_17505 [Acidimicrobiales bacterium]|nr:hypothetical protein [Acidimicrobiales bacterium]
MSALDFVVAMAVVAAVVFSLLSDPPELSAASQPRASRPPVRLRPRQRSHRWAPGASLVGDLLFVERLGGRSLGLDCLLRPSGPPAGHAACAPVHIRARCAVTWWAAERFMHLVTAWAEGQERVAVEIVPYGGTLRAKVSHGASCLILDVVNSDDLVLTAVKFRAAA